MTAPSARMAAGRARRPRWRAYLLLSRISNLPTVWTNVVAGASAVAVPLDWYTTGIVVAAASCFYTGGMFLNDAFDASFDRAARSERPIPAGDVSRAEAFTIGGGLLMAALMMLVVRPRALPFGAALGAAIVLYDYRHKGVRFAPLVMGLCRGLVYCVAAAAAGAVTASALVGGAVMVGYVAGLTVVARAAGAQARWLVPVLIAGISLVDALFVLIVTGSPALAAGLASAFALTLFLQRYVPGD